MKLILKDSLERIVFNRILDDEDFSETLALIKETLEVRTISRGTSWQVLQMTQRNLVDPFLYHTADRPLAHLKWLVSSLNLDVRTLKNMLSPGI